jgi:hypothetical protein
MVEDGRSDQLAGKWRFSKFAQVIVSAKLDIGTLSVVGLSGSSLRETLAVTGQLVSHMYRKQISQSLKIGRHVLLSQVHEVPSVTTSDAHNVSAMSAQVCTTSTRGRDVSSQQTALHVCNDTFCTRTRSRVFIIIDSTCEANRQGKG